MVVNCVSVFTISVIIMLIINVTLLFPYSTGGWEAFATIIVM